MPPMQAASLRPQDWRPAWGLREASLNTGGTGGSRRGLREATYNGDMAVHRGTTMKALTREPSSASRFQVRPKSSDAKSV